MGDIIRVICGKKRNNSIKCKSRKGGCRGRGDSYRG